MKKNRNSHITLKQVAEHAGVSRATASLVVRNSPNVSEKTRKKVMDSINELGYIYNRIAANMRSERSLTIGLIITDISNTFFSELLIGAQHALEERGYTVLLGTTFDSDTKQNKLLSTMLEHRVDGIILCPASETSKETIDRINNLDVPIVSAVRKLPNLHCDYVGINYKMGAELAVKYLIKNGHSRIAFVGGNPQSSTWKERKLGYENTLKQAGIEVDESLVISSVPTKQGGRNAIQILLNQPNKPTAIFCFSDLIAFGVSEGLKAAGINPGIDMAIVGFDNVPEAANFHPSLTTVSSYPRLIGNSAARMLYKRTNEFNEDQQCIILQPELVVRSSS